MSIISLTAIDKKINDTIMQLSEARNISNEDIASLVVNQLNKRLEVLKENREEILDSQTKETLCLRMHGENVPKGRIAARILISVLKGFQDTVDSIANAVINNKTTNRRLPEYIRSITDFQVVGTFDGSFGIQIEKEFNQLEKYSEFSQTSQVLSETFTLLENSDDNLSLLDTLIPLGKGTVNNYKEWLYAIKQNDINLEINWLNNTAESRVFDIRSRKIQPILVALESIEKIDEEEKIYKGVLTGVNIRNYSFEMNIEGIGIIKGKSQFETLLSVTDMIGKEVTAELIVSISYSKTNIKNTSWYLKGISI